MNATSDTRERILNAAQDFIQRQGLNAMSFHDLSKAVGIRKPSVHHHFATKADMVNALLDRYQVNFRRVVDAIVNSRVSGKTKLKRYCELFLSTLEQGNNDNGCLCGMLVAEMYSLNLEGVQRVRKFFQSNVDAIQAMLVQGAEDGSLNGKGSPDVVLATLEGGLLTARCEGGPKRFAEMINGLIRMLS
jgi:TetR/AcrR family transcriptional repressor of nem operon